MSFYHWTYNGANVILAYPFETGWNALHQEIYLPSRWPIPVFRKFLSRDTPLFAK
jgi:hypothetical protein